MAFNPEEIEQVFNDYGIVVSERTRRLIHRNHKKIQKVEVPKERFILWSIIKKLFAFLKSIIYTFLNCILCVVACFIWIALGILQIMLEIYVAALICYVVAEFIKRNA